MKTQIEFVPLFDGNLTFTVNGKAATEKQREILLHVLNNDPATRQAMTFACFQEPLSVPDTWPKA